MATNWPNSVDAFTAKTDGVDLIMAAHVNNLQDATYANQVEIARTYRPDLKPAVPSAYDDEFEAAALNAKWTAINCANGTVNMLTTAAAADTYDLATFTGMLALQPGRDAIGGAYEAEAAMVRQTVVPAATCKFVTKLRHINTADSGGMLSFAGIMLSGVGGFSDNDYLMGGISFGWPVPITFAYGEHNIGGAGSVILTGAHASPSYIMITKTANVFSVFSGDGTSWSALSDFAAPDTFAFTFGAGVMVRLTLMSYFYPAMNEFNPISAFDFVRYFANNTPTVNA